MRIKDHNKVAFYTAEDVPVTYADVALHVSRFSRLLSIRKGDRVILFAENRPEWIYALYSVWYNDGIPVPVDASMPAAELAWIIGNAAPKTVYCSKGTRKTVTEALKQAKKPRTPIIVLDNVKPLKTVPPLPDLPPHPKDDTAVIIYTSGTTGNPKGVMLSFDNLRANQESIKKAGMIRPEHTILNLLPFHHILPLQGNVLMPFDIGCTTVFPKGLEKDLLFEAMAKYGISMLIAVPRIYELLHNGIMTKLRQKLVARVLFRIVALTGSRTLGRKIFGKVHRAFGGHIDTMVSGGAKLDETIYRNMITLGFNLVEGYGTSETAPMISFNRNENVRIGSPGQPIHGAEVEIRDGEIVTRGRHVMQGYWKNPEATKRVLKKGWYHTGDTGYIDRDGFIHITGRKDELIVLPNGKNINPEDIETSILGMSPLIKDIGVVASGGQLVALVVPDQTRIRGKDFVEAFEMIRDLVIEKYNRTVANYKKIFNVKLVQTDFPRTRLGKLKRFLLNDLLKGEEKKKAPVKAPSFREYTILRKFLEELKETEIAHYDHLEYDLAMDSLDRVELQAFAEKTFGMTLDARDLAKAHTPEKLAELIRERKTRIDTEGLDWNEILREDCGYRLPKKHSRFPHRGLMRRLFRKRFDLTVTGSETLPEGPFILAPNHESYLDALILTAILPDEVLFNTFFWVKDSPVMSKVVKLFSGGRNTIILNIEKDLKGSLQKSAAVLRGGKNLLIFPEGTRTYSGELGKFKKAFAILGKELDIPVVPVAIEGAFEAMPRGKRIPKKGPISIDFLKPVKAGRLSHEAFSAKVEAMIRKRLQSRSKK